MKQVVIAGLMVGLLIGGEAWGEQTLADWFKDVVDNMTLEQGGYDSACVRVIQRMRKAGEISKNQAELMIYEKCRKPPPQEQNICPICGERGFERLGLGGKRWYRCLNGHEWK